VLVNDCRPMTRPVTVALACLLIGQLNYAKCGSEYRFRTVPSRPKAELTPEEAQRGCAISSIWHDLHMAEIQCPAASAVTAHRFCTDGATVGIFRKKDDVLVNCRIEPGVKSP
jgi:hypothetical protein